MNKRIIVALFLMVFLLSACSNMIPIQGAPYEPDVKPPAAPSAGQGQKEAERGFSDETNSLPGQDRLVIKNASLTLSIRDAKGAAQSIADLAAAKGGYVVSSNIYQVTRAAGVEVSEGMIIIRVPVDRLDETLAAIQSLVESEKDVRNLSITGEDVTEEYVDLQSRLRNLENTEAQLLKIQAEATTTEDVLNVFRELERVRAELEQVKGRLQYLEKSARFSSISVQLNAKLEIEPVTTEDWQIQAVVRDALQTLVDLGKILVEAVIRIVIVFLPLAIVFGVPTWLIIRAVRRRRAKAQPPGGAL